MAQPNRFRSGPLIASLALVALGANTDVTHAQQVATPTAAPSGDSDALIKRIDALEAEVKQLRNEQAQASQPKIDQKAVDSTINSIHEDAQHRDSLLDASSISAHYTDNRFVIRTNDGNFLIHPWMQLQVRDVTTFRHDGKQAGESDDAQNGFEIRRLKFGFDGNVFTPDLTYVTQFAVDRKTGNVNLEMAWAKYHFETSPFSIKVGQFKDPLDHEQLGSTRSFSPIDRSLVDDIFANGEGFVKGVSLVYEPADQNIRAEAAFTDGLRNYNTNFVDFPNSTNPADWGAAARAEYKAFGRWKDYDKFNGANTQEQTLVFGAGADYTEAGDNDALVHVFDAQFTDPSGLLVYGAYLGRYTHNSVNGTTNVDDTYDSTARALVSYAIDKRWEPYVEYSFIHFDAAGVPAGGNPNVHMFTVGTNYYLRGQFLKLQFDLSYLPNGSPVADDGIGVLVENHPNEIIARAQFQLQL